MKRIEIEKKVLSENDIVAARLRAELASTGALALNFIGSPGRGRPRFSNELSSCCPCIRAPPC